MREIKFRGETFGSELVCGDLIHFVNGKVAIADGFESRFVKPESVAQLVGYDEDGNDVYEDDTLINLEYGYEDHDFVTACDDKYYLGDQFFGYKLKK